MPSTNFYTVRYTLHRYDGADQPLQIRLGYLSRLLTRSPFVGLPFDIVYETPPTPMADAQFPLPLRELEDPLFCQAYVEELLSSFNLGRVTSTAIARKITSFVVQMASGNYETKFHIVTEIDYVQLFWLDRSAADDGWRGVPVQETVIFEEARGRRGAPETAIERLKKETFDGSGGEEWENCSVCYDEMKDGGEEVSRIPCGHAYHKSCILTWLQRSHTCPLCRKKLEED